MSLGTNHDPCPAHPGQWYNKSTGDCSCGGNHRGPVTASKCIVDGCNLTVSRVSLPGNVEGVLTCNRGHKQEQNADSVPDNDIGAVVVDAFADLYGVNRHDLVFDSEREVLIERTPRGEREFNIHFLRWVVAQNDGSSQ